MTLLDTKEVILLGAYGYTARKIARLLNNEGISFVVVGRDLLKLKELKKEFQSIYDIIQLDINDATELNNLITGCGILINCIGPFNINAGRVIERCASEGVHYLDITGEQHIVVSSMTGFSQTAAEKDSCILHSVAFESALADLMASAFLPEGRRWREVSTIYYFERALPSFGTRLTMQTSKYFPTYCVRNGRLVESDVAAFTRRVEYSGRPGYNTAMFMPYPEVIFFHRRYNPEMSGTYLLSTETEARFLVASNRKRTTLDAVLEREYARQRPGPDEMAFSNQYFEVTLYAIDESGQLFRSRLSGKDMYGLTASIVVALLKELQKAKITPSGLRSPAEVIEKPSIFLEKLIRENHISANQAPQIEISNEEARAV